MIRPLGKLWLVLPAAGLLSLAALALAPVPQEKPPATPPGARQQQPEIVPAADLQTVAGARLSAGRTYDNQPAVAETSEGTSWVAWVRYYNHQADEIVVASRHGDRLAEPVVLTRRKGQYIRPVLAAAGNEVWCAWTVTEPDKVSTVWYSRMAAGQWSAPQRVIPDQDRPHQNPEIAAAADGRVAVVCQVHTGAGYDVYIRVWEGKEWGPVFPLSEGEVNDWDPSVAFDAKGGIHVVWSSYREGDYDIYWTPRPGRVNPRRISARGEYDLHPSIAASPDGTLWVSWDVVRIPLHGHSGRTTITGANHRGGTPAQGDSRGVEMSAIEVRVLDGDKVRVPGKPREELAPPKGFLLAHCAMAKVAVGPGGEPWVFHRALRRAANSPGIGYYWDLLARPFRAGKWGEAVHFSEADGYLEEAGLASTPRGIRVAYGGEHRNAHIPKQGAARPANPAPPHEDPPGTPPHDHHRDFDRTKGWNGEVYLATVAEPPAKGPERSALAEAPAPADRPARDLPRAPRYRVAVGQRLFQLLWGDTHRHSNVSRCSQGAEPSPDDLYRYGEDICRYDFLALSDHAEDPRQAPYDVIDYYWWKQQKLADLYHVPGAMSVLYNFEWSLPFPHGHHNTIFPSRPTIRLDRSLAASSTLAGGWKLLEKEKLKAITIPHTGADPRMGTAWEVQDDRYQRLCEIFQACRGSYEHSGCPREFTQTGNKQGFYWNALEKGYHVGVIASTDHGYGCSYACVYAEANTREAVWQAMWDRRTYGATTYGLVLDFRSGEHWMGEEWSSKEAAPLQIYVKGAKPIRSVEIIGRSRVLHAEGSADKPLNKPEHRIEWQDPDWAAQTQEQWYYVRVIQVDDEMAWSSPVWVKPEK